MGRAFLGAGDLVKAGFLVKNNISDKQTSQKVIKCETKKVVDDSRGRLYTYERSQLSYPLLPRLRRLAASLDVGASRSPPWSSCSYLTPTPCH